MKRYTYQRNKKSRKEKVGFITAFSICIVAIGLALGATYASIGGLNETQGESYTATLTGPTVAVNHPLTLVVTEKVEETVAQSEPSTMAETLPEDPTESERAESDSLQTMLQVTKSLDYPIEESQISKVYSEDAIYNMTMGDYRSHLGVDFLGDVGGDVCAMGDGVVEKIYEDTMYGNVIVITDGNFSVYYCGLAENVFCTEGSEVSRGEVIGTVGTVPCEAQDLSHVHVEVRVGEKTVDPLSVISSNQ